MPAKNHLGSEYLHRNRHFSVMISPIAGYGLFARRTFEPEERVLDFTGDLYDAREMPILLNDSAYDKENDKYIQVSSTHFLGPYMRKKKGLIQFDEFVNHSCNPNTLVRSPTDLSMSLFARKQIRPGEEITHDYSTAMINDSWTMEPCTCGESACRGVIGDFLSLPKALQEQYITENGVPNFFLEILRRQKA